MKVAAEARLHPGPEGRIWRWSIVDVFVPDGLEKPMENVRIVNNLNLQANANYTNGSLILLHGTDEHLPQLWRIFEVRAGSCRPITNDPLDMNSQTKTLLGKHNEADSHSRKGGNWLFDPWTGELKNGVSEYRISVGPGYLQAIHNNWWFSDHFKFICQETGKMDMYEALVTTPAAASVAKELMLETQRLRKQAAIDATLVEKLKQAVRVIGLLAYSRRKKGIGNELHSLRYHGDKAIGTCGFKVAEDFVKIFGVCREASPEEFGSPSWNFNSEEMFI